MSLNKDYMDIDEFLNSRDLCDELELPNTDEDFGNMTVPIDFKLSEDQLHEYTASEIEIASDLVPSPISSEGNGNSISSENSSENEKHPSISHEVSAYTGQEAGKAPEKKLNKKIIYDRVDSSKSRTSTWKVSKSDKQCVETSVEIEGVSYTYNLVPTAKGRKPNRRSVPGDLKDEKYWDRRLKNNEAAKRSRDLRRQKEMLVASKAADLQAENEELKAEVLFLKERVKILSKKLQGNDV